MLLSYNFSKVRLWVEDGILFCQFLNDDINSRLTERETKQYLNAIGNLTKDQPLPLLIDVRNVVGHFTIAAAKKIAQNEIFQTLIICQAFVVNAINGKLLVLSYKRIYDKKQPFKIFYNIQHAINYCIQEKKNFYEGT